MEASQLTVNGIHLQQRKLEFLIERDGMRIPHTLKELLCSPPAHISTVMDYVSLTETVNGLEQKILT
jgi:hypothetical protein